jgi:mono/diheme cytochrome c family protein
MRAIILPSFLLALTACTAGSSIPAAPPVATSKQAPPAGRGLLFAQNHCASCHAIANGSSPNVNAPAFADVINDADLTNQTLTTWLRNSHNFPAIMNFEIAPENIDDLAAHMLTLKDPKYKPRI